MPFGIDLSDPLSALKGMAGKKVQSVADSATTNKIADTLQEELGTPFKRDAEKGTATAQLSRDQAQNLRNVLQQLVPEEKEKLFGKLRYEVTANDQLVVSGMANLGAADSTALGFSFGRNGERAPALKEAIASGNVDKVREVAKLPPREVPATDKAAILNKEVSPTLTFRVDGNDLIAPLDSGPDAKQKKQLQAAFAVLTPEEKKAVKGDMVIAFDTKNGVEYLALKNAAGKSVAEISDFASGKNGSVNALLAAVNGAPADGIRDILKGEAIHNKAPAPVTEKSVPLSQNDLSLPVDLGKLAAAGLKIPEVQASASGHGSGLEAAQQETARGRA